MMGKIVSRKIGFVALMVLIIISLAISISNSPLYASSKKIITIGHQTCLSGPYAEYGHINEFGARQAVEYINKEQLLGQNIQLKLLVADDHLNATVGLNAYQSYKDKVLAFSCYDTSGCSGLRSFCEKDKKPMVATTTNNSFLYPPSPYVFGVALPYEELLVGLLKAVRSTWKEERKPKIGFISTDIPAGRVPINAAKKYCPSLGWDIDPIVVVPLASADFSHAISQVKAKKPDWVLLSLVGGQIKSSLEHAGIFGVKEKTNFSLSLWGGFTESTFKSVGREALENTYGFCSISNPEVHAGAKKWAAWTKANAGKECDESGNSGAAGIFIIYEAMRLALQKVNVEDLNGPNLVKYGFQRIKNFQMFGDLMPPVTYGPNRTRGCDQATMLRMKNGHLETAIPWFDIPSLGSK